MKDGIHPTYNKQASLECSCGNKAEVGSTEESLQVEVCSACHPFYTGKQKLVDAAGRIDKFKKRMQEAEKAEKADTTRRAQQQKKSKAEESKEENSGEIKLG